MDETNRWYLFRTIDAEGTAQQSCELPTNIVQISLFKQKTKLCS